MRLGSTTMTARAHPPMPVGFWALAGELVHYRVRCAAMPASCAGLLAEAKVTLRAVLRHGTRHGHHQGAIFKMECGMGRTIGSGVDGAHPITAASAFSVNIYSLRSG